jgi:hypothetical protein
MAMRRSRLKLSPKTKRRTVVCPGDLPFYIPVSSAPSQFYIRSRDLAAQMTRCLNPRAFDSDQKILSTCKVGMTRFPVGIPVSPVVFLLNCAYGMMLV